MWISLFCTLIVTLLVRVIEGITKQQPCCTGVFSRGLSTPNYWHKGLQEAVYHSLTQHSAFDGSLDDRVERDRRLWKRVQAAEFSPEISVGKDRQTGLLVNADLFLEFQPSSYICRERDCKKSIMAIWEMRKTEHPRGYYIIVKLPVSHTYIQDSYEYTSHDGLKHLGAENIHKQHIYHYTIGSDGKHSFKQEQRRAYKPMKFPGWNKQKTEYDVNRKDFNNANKKQDTSKEDNSEDEDKIIRIEPRRKFQYVPADPAKPKKQGLVVAYIPDNSRKEFQIPDQKYDGFLPLIHALSKEANEREGSYKDASQEKEYDIRHIKVYEDVIKKFINEQRNRPKTPLDFRPSKPYVQYSEPDPLYIEPSYVTPHEEPKTVVDDNKFLIVHKYPDSLSSQLPIGNVATPTVPYISVTVSNKIPVQNFNHIDLSTTMKTTVSSSTSTTTTVTSTTKEPIMNTTNVDVELITIPNDTMLTTRPPPKNVASNVPSIDTSREELTPATVQPTTSIIIKSNNGDISTEETSTLESTQTRNIIKKDTSSKTSNVDETDMNFAFNDLYNINNSSSSTDIIIEDQSSMSTSTAATTIPTFPTTDIMATTEILDQNVTENINTNINTTIQDQLNLEDLENITQQPTLLNISETSSEANATSVEADDKQIETEKPQSTTTQQTMTENTFLTTSMPETTTRINYYIDEARSQLADLFASITFDLFDSQSPLESEEEEPINYSALLSSGNQPEAVDSTNYDDFLIEELAEPSNQSPQQYAASTLVHQKSSKKVSNSTTRQYTNSH